MDVTITIPEDVARKLEQCAEVMGQSIAAYTSKLVTETVTKPTIDELLKPVRDEFSKSGLTEEQLVAIGKEALDAARQEKKAKSA